MRRIVFAAAAVALLACLMTAGRSPGQGTQKTLLPTNGWGSLSGRVTFADDPLPTPDDMTPKMQIHADKACCLAKTASALEKVDNTWIVDPKNKGVRFVLVYLKAPPGTYFPIHEADKKRAKKVVIDQPHCMFVPHVAATFPSFYDGKEDVETGEKVEFKNSAPVPHNTRATGNPLKNPGFNVTLPPGASKLELFKAQNTPVMINCDIHPWMKAWLGVYDHPYFAVTEADGSYNIERVPAGATVTVFGWHEAIGFLPGRDGQKVELKAGKNTVDISITLKKKE
jgi:hypothetical protein